MELNYLIFAGLVLRYLYYWSNSTYTWEYLKTKLWKTIVFSILVAVLFWYITTDISMTYSEWWQKPAMALAYVFIGWAVDSVFLSLMKVYDNRFQKGISS